MLTFMLRLLKDQRGEVGEAEAPDEVDETADELDEEDVVVIDPDELEEDSEPKKEKKKEKSEQPDLKAELDKRDSKLQEYEKQIKDMNRNFYGLRKKLKSLEKPAQKETKFTDEQLKGMLEEHEGDPDALLNIMRHVAQQEASSESKKQVDASEISKRKKDMDKYLLETFPDALTEGSKDHKDIQQAKDYLHLSNHPLGDSLAAAMTMWLQMPDLIEDAKKQARESALKREDNRKKSIKETSVETPPKKKAAPAKGSKKLEEVAKQMGLKGNAKKIYFELVSGKNKTATVEG